MIRAALFADLKNLYYYVNKQYPGKRVDYTALKKCSVGVWVNAQLSHATAFGTEIKNEAGPFRNYLKSCGYEVLYRRAKYLDANGVYQRASWDAGLTISIAMMACRLDAVVLASSNEDFIPVMDWCRNQGLLTHVVACGITRNLAEACNYVTEINDDFLTEEECSPDPGD